MYCQIAPITFYSDLGDIINDACQLSDCETPSPSPTVSPCESEPDNFHKSQTYGLASVKARNTDTAILCGCIGHFFWEIVPAKNLAFYRGTAPECVEHCISSRRMCSSFNDAYWTAYNACLSEVQQQGLFSEDCVIAIYQQHLKADCPKYFTRYTLGSVKEYIKDNEAMRGTPILNSFCRCITNISSEDLAYNVCFTCMQCTLELKACSLVGVLKHFSYEVTFKPGFLDELRPERRNTREYFLAQDMFENAISTWVKHGTNGYLHTWTVKGMSWQKQKHVSMNKSFCILCHQPGNGYNLFVCSNCTQKSSDMFKKFMQ